MYTLETNYCNCHPATCSCDPWVIKRDGRKFVTVFDKENGELIIKAMNKMRMEQRN
jgi:hypothetical protein